MITLHQNLLTKRIIFVFDLRYASFALFSEYNVAICNNLSDTILFDVGAE